MTRALHLLLNGDFIGAIYFNWLAFPFLGAIIFLFALFAIEIAKRRVIWRLRMVLRVTRWRLTVFGLGLLLLWTLQTYLAVSQHKHELLNTQRPALRPFCALIFEATSTRVLNGGSAAPPGDAINRCGLRRHILEHRAGDCSIHR